MNKQVEEMAKIIALTEQIARDAHCGLPSPTMYAQELYWHGCRVQSKGTWKTHSVSYECSRCGEEFFIADVAEDYDAIEDLKMNYCPNCGEKMKGEESDA